MGTYDIRIIGDPVLRQPAKDVTDVDGALVRIIEGMVDAMYDHEGLAVAAPQVGVSKRVVVYHLPDREEPEVIINPRIVESSEEEWLYNEGCLSIPGLFWEVSRPKTVHVVGLDVDGNEVSIEADELEGRMYQHELDHLDGILMTERLSEEQRKEAKAAVRELMMRNAGSNAGSGAAAGGGLSLH